MASYKPVARMGDPTAHGGVIVEGDETVLIGGKPVARVGDHHTCPIKKSGKPHEGGPLLPTSSPLVLVGEQQVTLMGDQAVCKGSNDIVAQGEPTVVINTAAEPGGVSAKGQAVLARYEKTLTGKLQVSAQDLAAGKLNKELSPEQASQWVVGLLTDLPLMDTPIGLNLGLALGLEAEELGLSPKELGKVKGKALGDRALAWVEQFKGDHPGLFWSAAALAVAGAAATTYTQGTDALAKVGVKPQYKGTFFDKNLAVDGKAEFGPEFTDPKVEAGVRQKVGDNVSVWGKGTAQGEDLSNMEVVKYSFGTDYTSDDKSLKAGVAYSHDELTDTDRVSGYLRGSSDGTTYGVDALVDPNSGGHSVSGYAGRKFSESGSIDGFVKYQDMGGVKGTSAGVVLRFTF